MLIRFASLMQIKRALFLYNGDVNQPHIDKDKGLELYFLQVGQNALHQQ
ncbi:hypothetical protein PROPEN_04698 [Proteus penneri ATCC 35198]|nr:hypothetical protein PROPEN_04698 [Proteus penneri ATCC 35198]